MNVSAQPRLQERTHHGRQWTEILLMEVIHKPTPHDTIAMLETQSFSLPGSRIWVCVVRIVAASIKRHIFYQSELPDSKVHLGQSWRIGFSYEPLARESGEKMLPYVLEYFTQKSNSSRLVRIVYSPYVHGSVLMNTIF